MGVIAQLNNPILLVDICGKVAYGYFNISPLLILPF